MQLPSQSKCVVIGGGPAGSTAAALIAAAGHEVLLLEREQFPRFQIGESLMPETYWTFKRLGVLEALKASAAPRKVGVQFVSADGRESAPFFFKSHDPRECSTTWHVRRSEFDQMLLDNAAKKGARCETGVRVLDVLMDADRAVGVVAQTHDGERHSVGASVVIDASGQQSVISKRLDLRQINPRLKNAAIWTYYRGAQRDEAGGGVRTIILRTKSNKGWFWYIPMQDDLTSVGVVGDRDELLVGRGSLEEIYDEELRNCPTVAEWVAGCERDAKFRTLREFSYSTRRSAGDGWVLIGDAWGFIDPVYSAGVFVAMKSAELAADCVAEGLAIGDTSEARIGKWIPGFAMSVSHIGKLISAFYDPAFRVGEFVKEFPHHQDGLVDLLIGRVFGPDAGALFKDLDPWLARRGLPEMIEN